jgi:hypothetical protein
MNVPGCYTRRKLAPFRTIIPDLAPDLAKQYAIEEGISSPAARCVETALRFADQQRPH